ncbi:NfeD family protein [Candidatus Galacturonibacter soehngenii]|uniref:NfeD family protein n=1 Tax=Candidatus Galacturonatibacter soehngenii TaxID=2307010 RepID=A0A7V7QHU6_9FIRM|nr:NfeD family protein [Candidatus Galacturonibacter soehngenii]KAB1434299.1 NfeD family protein [Candidatus Galacturonibacter soehngenii]MBA4686647.1 NfeD family protein [Candidatus Galacturonibacter soehngenii]
MYDMYWLILFVILLIIEIITLGLTTIWFAGGALAAFVASVFNASLGIQIILFFLVSFLLLFLTRPIAMRYLNQNRTKTNAESLIGKIAIVTKDISNIKGEGSVIVNGLEWSARSVYDEVTIAKDALVIIKEISGVKLIVEEKREENE